jgi:hypothetical protein
MVENMWVWCSMNPLIHHHPHHTVSHHLHLLPEVEKLYRNLHHHHIPLWHH